MLVLLPTSDQSFASGPSLIFSISEREQVPACALEEGAGGAPDRLGTTEYHLFAALIAEKDYAPRRIDHDYPSRSLFLRGRHALTPLRSAQGEPASTKRDLCFTQCFLNPRLRFHLARCLGTAHRGQSSAHAKGLPNRPDASRWKSTRTSPLDSRARNHKASGWGFLDSRGL